MPEPIHTGDILRAVFRLEAERTVCLARAGRVAGAEAALADVDARLGAALAALEARGVQYPLHMVAAELELDQANYLLLQLSLLPRHGLAAVHALTDATGERADIPQLSHALQIVAEGHDDWARTERELRSGPVLAQGLVTLAATPDGDAALVPGMAILELLGLAE